MISIVACCHGAKICAHATRGFQSHQNGAMTRMWGSCGVQAFTQRTCDLCGSLQKGGDVVATSPMVLR